MPLPDFTTPPQYLEVPAYPLVQPCFNGLPGPYSFSGTLFWIFCEDSSASANSAQLVAYSNASSTGTQPSTRIAPGTPINMAGQTIFTVTYPGTGSILYVTYREKASHTIHFVTFDMSTSTWGSPNDSTVVGDQFDAVCYGFQLSSGDFQIIYTADTSSPDQVATTIWNGASWSSPVNLTSSVTSLTLATAQLLPSDKIGFWYFDSTNIYYGYCSGGSLLGSATVTTKSNLLVNEGVYSYYDPVSDTAAFSCVRIPSSPARELDILITSPAASTTTSVVTVFNDVFNDHGYVATSLAGNSSGNTFYLTAIATTDVQIHIFGSSSISSGWTASPAVFYDQSTNEPSPAPFGPEVLPLYSTFVSGTTFAVTAGFLCNVGSDPAFCGVMAAMIPGGGPPALVASCNNPPDGMVGVAYSHVFTATGGTPPYTDFSIVSGSLPTGLTIDHATGLVSGIPTAAGMFSFTVQVTDSASVTATVSCSITIIAPIGIACGNPPSGTEGVFYTTTLVTTGGSGTKTFLLVGGDLPLGLTLDNMTGVISGIPAVNGTFTFTVQVSDDTGIATVTCSISIIFVTAPTGCFTILYSWRSFAQPDAVYQWSTRKITFGFKGYMHLGRIEACWACNNNMTLNLTAFDGTSPDQIILPPSGNNSNNSVSKLYITPTFNKFQMLTADFTSSSNFQIYPREFIFWVKQWGSSGPYYPYRMGQEESVKP